MLFIAGAIVVAVVRDESDVGAPTESVETTTPDDGETTVEDAGDEAPSRLPRAYVVTRSRDQPTILSSDYVEVVSLQLEPGTYQVFGKLGLANRDPQLPFTAECVLVPSDPDGTPRFPERAGEFGSDYGDLRLGPFDQHGDTGTIPLVVSQVLDAPGSVVLACRGYGNDVGAFGHYASIRAIEVASIEANEEPVP